MTTRVRTYRTSTEVVGWRAQARAELADYLPTPYLLASRMAAAATLAWLVGDTPETPASGLLREPDDLAIGAELIFSRDAETFTRVPEEATAFATVARTLSWYMLDPGAPTPF